MKPQRSIGADTIAVFSTTYSAQKLFLEKNSVMVGTHIQWWICANRQGCINFFSFGEDVPTMQCRIVFSSLFQVIMSYYMKLFRFNQKRLVSRIFGITQNLPGSSRISQDLSGCPKISQDLPGSPRIFHCVLRTSWIYLDFLISQDLLGSSKIS